MNSVGRPIRAPAASFSQFPTTWSRPQWPFPAPPGFGSFDPSYFWGFPGCPPRVRADTPVTVTQSQPVSQSSVVSEVRDLLGSFKDAISRDLGSFSARVEALEIAHQESSHSNSVPHTSTPRHVVHEAHAEDVEDSVSVAPDSAEGSFLEDEDPPELEKRPAALVSKSSVADPEGSDSESEPEDTVVSKEQLKSKVYSLLRDKAKVTLASPPRIKKSLSTFEASCGLSQESSASYKSFPESKHVTAALQVIKEGLSSPSSKSSSGKFQAFGANSFPGRFRSKDFETHQSSIGKMAPTCDKSLAATLGSKSIDG